MSAVMISLVSEQAIPNVLAPLLVEERPRRVLCLVPTDLRRQEEVVYDRDFLRVFKGIRDVLTALGIGVQLGDEPIHPYDVDHIVGVCRRARREQASGDPVIFNITGGTKLMVLAAYRVAREQSPPDPVVYVDSETRSLVRIDDNVTRSRPFEDWRLEEVTPERYLRSYGITATFDDADLYSDGMYNVSRLILREEVAYQLVKKLRQPIEAALKTGGRAKLPRQCLTDAEVETLRRFLDCGILRELQEDAGDITMAVERHQFDYLAERWLTGYVYRVCRDIKDSKGCPVFAHCRWHGDLDWYARAHTGNRRDREIDACALRGGRILLIECKATGDGISPGNINKLHQLAARCGRYAQKLLVAVDRRLLDTANMHFRETIRHALLTEVAIVSRAEMGQLPQILQDIDGYIKTLRGKFDL